MIRYIEQQPFLYQNKDDGLLYFVNAVGHTRQIQMNQWADIIQAAVICDCHVCMVCLIYQGTLDIL